MKYALWFFLIICVVPAVGCQVGTASKTAYTSKGRVELGGNIGYTYSHQENDYASTLTRSFSFDNIIGYCVTDNIEFEFRPFCMYEKTIDRDKMPPISPSMTVWVKGAGGGPALTYNFSSGSNIVPFVTVGYGAIDFRYEGRSGGVSAAMADTVPVTIAIMGLKIFGGDSGCVRIGLGYTKMQYKKDVVGPESEFGLTLGYSVFF